MKETTTGSGSNKEGNPIWLGLKLLFADMGISGGLGLLVGFVIGFISKASGRSLEFFAMESMLLGIGFLVSVYMVFLLRRRYSQDIKALITMVVVGLIFVALNLYVDVSAQGSNLFRNLIITIAQPLTYIFGWYLAKTTSLQIFLLPSKLVTASFVIGIIIAFFTILGAISIMLKVS